ncbi:uncharacterized protein VNE69_06025 [Vairimorpha necatrix]|uniref:DRBM domain-containing protein n=1 Tax=Vairimorpha necatrix TaxID=6039 RepID=A0AAX4JCX1_9MICR
MFQAIIKKYTLMFPHLPIPIIKENKDHFNIFIFNIELKIKNPNELDHLLDQVQNKIKKMCDKKVENKSKKMCDEKKTKIMCDKKVENKSKILCDENKSKIVCDKNKTKKMCEKKQQPKIDKSEISFKEEPKLLESADIIVNSFIVHEKSAKSKMKNRNIQNNSYIPSFIEDPNDSKNNILNNSTELYSQKIAKYCSKKKIKFPEYVFEKSNGVYFCKATFMNENFESRYAYDKNTSKEDASKLIYSYIKYSRSEKENIKKTKLTVPEKKSPEETKKLKRKTENNVKLSGIFDFKENDDSFDLSNFYTF